MLLPIVMLGLGASTPLGLYPLQSKGLSPEQVKAVDAAVRGEIADLRSYQLFGAGQTEALLAPPGGLGLNCDEGQTPCLASLGRLLGASVVLFGQMDQAASELRLVDAKADQEVRRVRIEGKPEDSMREAVVSLLAPDRYVGAIEVTGEHGRLAVDNSDRSDLPLAGRLALPVGRHQITITLPGHASWNAEVEVKWRQCAHLDGERAPLEAADVPPRIDYTALPLEVPPSEPAPHPARAQSVGRQLSYLGFTVAVLGGAVGIVFGAIAENNASSLQSVIRPVPLIAAPTVAQEAGRAADFGVAANVTWGLAAAVGIAAVVLYVISPEYAPEEGHVEVTGANTMLRF